MLDWSLGHIPPSGIREILNLAVTRPGCLRMETGEPDFPPAPHIIEAFASAAQAGHNRYTATEGIPALREAISQKLWQINQQQRRPDEILVTPGGIPGLYLAFLGVAQPSDEILVPDPGWPDYLGGLISLRIQPTLYNLDPHTFLPDLEEIEQLISPKTKAIVVNFPGNPTGVLPDAPFVQALVELCQKHGLWIISDEVYDQIIFEGKATSPASLAPDHTLTIHSFSKTYAMTGWRLGYLSGPRAAIASLTNVAMAIWSSVAEPLQYAGIAALTGPQSTVSRMLNVYRTRRATVANILHEANIEHHLPMGSFYVLVNIRATMLPSREFCLDLLKNYNVAVAPGSAFGSNAADLVRISLASSDTTLEAGVRTLADAIHQLSQIHHSRSR